MCLSLTSKRKTHSKAKIWSGILSNPHFPRKETVAPMIDPGGIHDETEK